MKRALKTAFALCVVASALAAQGLQIPQPQGYVNDFAHVLTPSAQASISHVIDDVRAKSGGEIVVVTLPDLGGRPIEEVSLDIGREWKVGKSAKPGDPARNTGVIILIVPKESSKDGQGHVRIETGNGAEGFITDGMTGQYRDEAIPYFRQQDYGGAILLMTQRVAERFASEFHFQIDSGASAPAPVQRTRRTSSRSSGGIPPIVYVIILFAILSALGGRRRRGCLPIFFPFGGFGGGGGSWGGGGFGGGSGGFGGFGGGGGFSGGGSSGSW